MPFACSICEQESTKICGFCTKDACDNHLCERCGYCSDCCECDVPLDEATPHPHAVVPIEADPAVTSGDQAAESEPAAIPEAAVQPEAHSMALDEPPLEPLDEV